VILGLVIGIGVRLAIFRLGMAKGIRSARPFVKEHLLNKIPPVRDRCWHAVSR
jgi:hypothetical protein